MIKRSEKLPSTKRMIIQRFVPLPATSLASSLNIICMRWNEIDSGIEVYDDRRNVVGISKAAAKQVSLQLSNFKQLINKLLLNVSCTGDRFLTCTLIVAVSINVDVYILLLLSQKSDFD